MPRVRRIHYAWVVFAASFVTLLGAAGFRATPGILVDPLRDEFGWDRATVGMAVSINVLLFGFIGPFAAALQARYGLRKVTVVALVVIALGALGTTRMTEPWQLFLLWGVVVGVGSGCMATVFASTVASRWFVARRGLVMGALHGGDRKRPADLPPGAVPARRRSRVAMGRGDDRRECPGRRAGRAAVPA